MTSIQALRRPAGDADTPNVTDRALGSDFNAGEARAQALGYGGIVATIALVVAGRDLRNVVLDPDAFWHLRVADHLMAEGVGPLRDRLSFNSIDRPWTPYSWLAELMMAGVWHVGGPTGAATASAATLASFIALIGTACWFATRRDNNLPAPVPALLATIGAAVLAFSYFTFRPVALALVLIAAVAAIACRDRYRPTGWLWMIPLLTAVCVNVHLYALLIPAMLAAVAVGEWWMGRPWKTYAAVAGASALACCATPMLPGVLSTAFHYGANDPMVAGGMIEEMRPFWTGVSGRINVAIVLLAAVVVAMGHRRLSATDWLWLAMGLVLLLRFSRFTPLFAILAMPAVATALPRPRSVLVARPLVRYGALASASVLAVVLALAADTSGRDTDNFRTYPHAAADWVEANVPAETGRLVNEFNWGGYLAWRLGPERQTFLDGRTQLFNADFWHASYLDGPEARRELLAEVKADAAVVPTKGGIFRELLIDLGWRPAWSDETAVVLLPPQQQYATAGSE